MTPVKSTTGRTKKPAAGIRLNRFLSNAGVAARRKCDNLIFDGCVTVNHTVMMEPGYRVDPANDCVRVDKKVIAVQRSLVAYMLNKPRGVVTTAQDEHDRRKVTDLVPQVLRVFPVGRLDYDTTGLLVMTNDGDLAFRLTHPRYKVSKVYQARVDRDITEESLDRLRRGVSIGRGKAARAIVQRSANRRNRVIVTIHEGRNRQVRRMLETVGYQVKSLDRLEVAGLRLGKLQRGAYRALTLQEFNRLRRSVGLPAIT